MVPTRAARCYRHGQHVASCNLLVAGCLLALQLHMFLTQKHETKISIMKRKSPDDDDHDHDDDADADGGDGNGDGRGCQSTAMGNSLVSY